MLCKLRYKLCIIIIFIIFTLMSNQLNTISDESLLKLYRETIDAESVGELYKRYSLLVYGVCYKYLKNEFDAKDCAAEVFEIMLDTLKKHDIEYFKSWLFTVSKNHALRKIHKNNTLIINDIENYSEIFMENEYDLSLNIKEDKTNLLQKAISNLKEEQRTCIELFYYQQKPYQEVASITGYDLNKVKSAIQNGKRNLKIFMEENNNAHEQ